MSLSDYLTEFRVALCEQHCVVCFAPARYSPALRREAERRGRRAAVAVFTPGRVMVVVGLAS